MTDGDLATHAIIKSPNSIKTGDYIGMKFNKLVAIQTLTFAWEHANPRDTFSKAEVQYQDENDNWVTLKEPLCRNESFLSLKISKSRPGSSHDCDSRPREHLVCSSEIAVNRPVEKSS